MTTKSIRNKIASLFAGYDVAMTVNNLCDEIEYLHEDIAEADKHREDLDTQIDGMRKQIEELNKTVEAKQFDIDSGNVTLTAAIGRITRYMSVRQQEVCDKHNASKADDSEYFDAIQSFGMYIEQAADVFDLVDAAYDCKSYKWGHAVKDGASMLFATAMKRRCNVFADIAKVFRKEHPDQRQKDVMTEKEASEWKSLPKWVQDKLNDLARIQG